MPRGADFHESSFFGGSDSKLDRSTTTPWTVVVQSISSPRHLPGCRELEGRRNSERGSSTVCASNSCSTWKIGAKGYRRECRRAASRTWTDFDRILLSLGWMEPWEMQLSKKKERKKKDNSRCGWKRIGEKKVTTSWIDFYWEKGKRVMFLKRCSYQEKIG